MPDENKDAVQVEIDPASIIEALKPAMAEAVKAGLAEQSKRAPAHVGPVGKPDAGQPDPLAEVLDPYLRPIRIGAAAAADFAKFYAIHPEAKDPEVQVAVEAKFGELLNAGTPWAREDILNWYKGVNFDKFADARNVQIKADQDRAAMAATVGPGVTRGGPIVMGDPFAMAPDELDKALVGASF